MTTTQPNVEALKKIGNEWIAGDKHRIYFNDPAQYIDGISNSRARKINIHCKVFFDVTDGKFYHQGLTTESAASVFAKLGELAK